MTYVRFSRCGVNAQSLCFCFVMCTALGGTVLRMSSFWMCHSKCKLYLFLNCSSPFHRGLSFSSLPFFISSSALIASGLQVLLPALSLGCILCIGMLNNANSYTHFATFITDSCWAMNAMLGSSFSLCISLGSPTRFTTSGNSSQMFISNGSPQRSQTVHILPVISKFNRKKLSFLSIVSRMDNLLSLKSGGLKDSKNALSTS